MVIDPGIDPWTRDFKRLPETDPRLDISRNETDCNPLTDPRMDIRTNETYRNPLTDPRMDIRTNETDRNPLVDPSMEIRINETNRLICAGCSKRIDKMPKHTVHPLRRVEPSCRQFINDNRNNLHSKRNKPYEERTISEGDSICQDCYNTWKREKPRKQVVSSSKSDTNSTDFKDETINLSLLRTALNGHACVFRCKKQNSLVRVPKDARNEALVTYRIFIPSGTKCCEKHLLKDGKFCINDFDNLKSCSSFHDFTGNEIIDIIDTLRSECLVSRNCSPSSQQGFFGSLNNLTERQCVNWTGLSKERFTTLENKLVSLSLPKNRSKTTALALFLAKLRTGESDERLACLFNLSQSVANQTISSVSEALSKDFLPNYMGISRLSRENIISHNTPVAKALFCEDKDDKTVVIYDSTYIYLQKSANHLFQRETYSGYKHRPLVRVMVGVAPNGYIIDCTGPFTANLSDATILKSMLQVEPFEVFDPGDVFILDRGFRDVIPILKAEGYDAHMPAFREDKKQLSWEQANSSRLATKCRYVVEVINGYIKNYNIFDRVWKNKALPHLFLDFKIVAAILNFNFTPIISDAEDGPNIAKQIILRSKPNFLANLVKELGLNNKRAIFRKMDQTLFQDFPKLSPEDLKFIALGSCCLKLAPSYISEKFRKEGQFEIQLYKHDQNLELSSFSITASEPQLIRGRIFSRYRDLQNIFFIFY